MLKLKYLFPNFALAEMIVQNWENDNLDLFKYWRISANAIFPFKNENNVYMLRFTPTEGKVKESILAELHFLNYLKAKGYKAIEVEASKNGNELEVVNTPWGEYYVAVFKRVAGESLDDTEITDSIAYLWGCGLGKLHKLSQEYKPGEYRRWNWEEQMEWIIGVLKEFPKENNALNEAQLLTNYLRTVPISNENYGLIHYDFELDNVFYDKATNSVIPIDFDDAMYNWYALDIECTLDTIDEEIEPDRSSMVKVKFLEGYRSEKEISEEMLKLMPVFHRLRNLYGYTRILNSSKEKWDNEPEWLTKLRVKFDELLKNRSSEFGKEINI